MNTVEKQFAFAVSFVSRLAITTCRGLNISYNRELNKTL